ncbi:DegT/DnrJ/EryC1/StrS family aminotransferase [Bacillus sp. PS06]|uniref:DegT/DnrJ/EryC1/StrS family aminotransferase n=1 Tax=Bacillus sp. PS06 TaxID=2764176 RepID=UPI001783D903|nr:aminotransferase class I/II-fold pyridoxal phosphate-dependent enzyme [Bacillus sp. PS06]MBD8071311.1 aminotransferase class I/II-fold pyridoxal phosphate-dependent enzyme [Bacillus sp. PS06]
MSGNEFKYINQAFDTNWVAPLGPNVDAFEAEIAQYVGASEAVAVNSGTAAIHLALSLLGVKTGDKVFCSSLTFIASANPIIYQGAEPIFIDSEPETWNMSPQALEKAFNDSIKEGILPKAVIVVNLYGQSAKMDEIIAICNQYDVPIIEDAAESLGSKYKGIASGTFGKFGTYSFNGNKIITTSGGGVLISDDRDALQQARFLATQARDTAIHYQHSQIGYNYRLSNILAGIGRAQLEVLDQRIDARRAVFKRYYNELSQLPGFTFMPELDATFSNRWLTALTINEKEAGVSVKDIISGLIEENIEARPVWKPLHLQPVFNGSRYYPHDDQESVSDTLFTSGVCLPSGSNLKEEELESVIHHIKQIVNNRKVSFRA